MPAKLTWRDGRTHRRAGLTSLCSTRFKRPIILSLEQVFLIHQNYRLQLQPASAACALFQSINIIKKVRLFAKTDGSFVARRTLVSCQAARRAGYFPTRRRRVEHRPGPTLRAD